jgi:hypothetical protein
MKSRHSVKSIRVVNVESYVTVRSEWPDFLSRTVSEKYNARGIRVIEGHMEWKYFAEEADAKKWAEAVHEQGTRKSHTIIHANKEAAKEACREYSEAVSQLSAELGVQEECEDSCCAIYVKAQYYGENGEVLTYSQ